MSAPSKACNIQMVKVHRGERLANTPERTFAPGGVTCLREAKGKGYRATTQVKGLAGTAVAKVYQYGRWGGVNCTGV